VIAWKAPQKKILTGEVVRKNFLVPGMGFEESTFYIGDQEIAKEKIVNGKVEESSGEVPDGKVAFIDNYRNTHGEEYYLKGKKHGPQDTYVDKNLASTSEYLFGKLVNYKEYYPNGTVRMEEDYTDELNFPNDPTHETGAGKLFYPEGTLKYEWSFVKGNQVNYRKSYNRDGVLILEAYYDRDGDAIKK
jgi:antitoxin component YwqK of YwqJK toxin-antitoxin module